MQCVAEHPLFTLQGVVPSLSCSGAFWLFRFLLPTPFTLIRVCCSPCEGRFAWTVLSFSGLFGAQVK